MKTTLCILAVAIFAMYLAESDAQFDGVPMPAMPQVPGVGGVGGGGGADFNMHFGAGGGLGGGAGVRSSLGGKARAGVRVDNHANCHGGGNPPPPPTTAAPE